MFACWPLGTLQWSPPCLEEYNSLDHSPALLLYCVCVLENMEFPSLSQSIFEASIVPSLVSLSSVGQLLGTFSEEGSD